MRLSGYIIGVILLLTLVGSASAAAVSMPMEINEAQPEWCNINVTVPLEDGINSNYSNIRFFANNSHENGGTEIPYHIADIYANSALVYLRFPADTTEFYCEWDIPGETASESNGTATYEWFDGFDSPNLNTSNWLSITGVYIADGIMHYNTTYRACGTVSINPLNHTFIWRANSTTADGHNSGTVNVSSTSQASANRTRYQIVGSPAKFSAYTNGSAGTNPYSIPNMTISANEFCVFELHRETGKNSHASIRNSTGAYAGVSRLNDSYGNDEPVGFFYITGNGAVHNMSIDYAASAKSPSTPVIVTVNGVSQVGPVSNFTSDITNATAPATIHYYDISTGSPTYWLWNFGDGNISYEQNPTHTFYTATNYTVSLTVNNAYGSDVKTVVKYNQIGTTILFFNDTKWVVKSGVSDPANNTWGYGQDSAFVDGSGKLHMILDNASGIWEAVELISADSHRYGIYRLVVDTPILNLDHNAIFALFGYNSTGPFGPQEFDSEWSHWSDQVSSLPWSITGSSNDVVWNSLQPYRYPGNRMTCIPENSPYINMGNATYIIEWRPDSIRYIGTLADGTVLYDYTCTNVTGIPKNQVKTAINLWANDSMGYTPATGNAPFDGQPIEVVISSLTYTPLSAEVNITANDTYHSLPFDVQFFDASTTNTTDWNWDFGDGTTSTEQNPSHTYTVAGTYTVSFEATNDTGIFTKSTLIDVEEAPEQDISIYRGGVADSLKIFAVNSSNVSIGEGVGWYQGVLDTITSGLSLYSLIVLVLGGAAILRFLGYI